MDTHNKLAILCGGGPAPGLNSVIAAATIRARLEGIDVIGLRDGFEWVMQGDIDHITPLTIEGVSRIHFRGGSHIGIARANPSKSPALLENTIQSLLRLNVYNVTDRTYIKNINNNAGRYNPGAPRSFLLSTAIRF